MEKFGQRVLQRAQEMADADSFETKRFEGQLVDAAKRELQKQLHQQMVELQASGEQRVQEAEAAAQLREKELAAQIEKLKQDLEKLAKAKDKVDKALTKSQTNLKIAGMKAEKDEAEIAKLQQSIRAKSETLMNQLFTELSLPVEHGKTPGELLRSLVKSHETAMHELQAELKSARATISKMAADAAEGNKHIIEERDVAVQERDASLLAVEAAEAARKEAEAEAERLRKEAKKVRADAKAQAKGEVDSLKDELTDMQTGKEEALAEIERLNDAMKAVQKELDERNKALRLAQAAGLHGGYYFSASAVRINEAQRARSASPPSRVQLPSSSPSCGDIKSPETCASASIDSSSLSSTMGPLSAGHASPPRMPIRMPLNGEQRSHLRTRPINGTTYMLYNPDVEGVLPAQVRRKPKSKGSKTKRKKAATSRAATGIISV